MKEFFNWLFKEYIPLREIYDTSTTVNGIIQNGASFFVFFLIGILAIKFAVINAREPGRQSRILMSRLIGLGMIFCSLFRLGTMLSYWENYPNLYNFFGYITAFTLFFVLGRSPKHTKLISSDITLEEVKHTMDVTAARVDEMIDLTKKIEVNK